MRCTSLTQLSKRKSSIKSYPSTKENQTIPKYSSTKFKTVQPHKRVFLINHRVRHHNLSDEGGKAPCTESYGCKLSDKEGEVLDIYLRLANIDESIKSSRSQMACRVICSSSWSEAGVSQSKCSWTSSLTPFCLWRRVALDAHYQKWVHRREWI